MGIKVTGMKSLSDFEKSLRKMQTGDLANRVATALAEEGATIARDEYSFTGVTDVSIYYENNGDGTAKIIAEGPGLNYIEFGTGIKGKGTYPDESKLPSETLTFISHGDLQTTEGWEYNYYKEQNKNKNPDLKDWTGFPAMAQMFNTAYTLRYSVNKIVKNELKGDRKR